MEIISQPVVLSLGSNLGNRQEFLERAIAAMKERIGALVAVSSVYESASWGYESTNAYLNCCVIVETTLSPIEVLDATQLIEREMGREKTIVYTDRVIDIDLLFYGQEKLNTERLIIPHPYWDKRAFVLLPLKDLIVSIYEKELVLKITKALKKGMYTNDIHLYSELKT